MTTPLDPATVLAAYDEQVRRHPERDGATGVERADGVVRVVAPDAGWLGVVSSDLDEGSADTAIEAQVRHFAEHGRTWEWKHYSHDRPADLPQRLLRHGLLAQPPEVLLVARIADLDLRVDPPPGVQVTSVADEVGAAAVGRVREEVFGGDASSIVAALRVGMGRRPPTMLGAVAWADGRPVSAGRLSLAHGSQFAGLWGGGTVEGWRRRGLFRALVAHRAATAAEAGFTYLQVDALPTSAPILRRLGFAELATTTPFEHPGAVPAGDLSAV